MKYPFLNLKWTEFDGKGNLMDDEGTKVSIVKMKVDEMECSMDDITSYDSYLNFKPPEKLDKKKANRAGDDSFEEKKSNNGRPVNRSSVLGLKLKKPSYGFGKNDGNFYESILQSSDQENGALQFCY
jgi:hypothetical protein